MRYGIINCNCGQQFYFESTMENIICITCKKDYITTIYPEKLEILEQPIEEVGEEDGTDI